VEIDYVAAPIPKDVLEEPEFAVFESIFNAFSGRAASHYASSIGKSLDDDDEYDDENQKVEDMDTEMGDKEKDGENEDDEDGEDEEFKELSKKRKKMEERLSVAQLKQLVKKPDVVEVMNPFSFFRNHFLPPLLHDTAFILASHHNIAFIRLLSCTFILFIFMFVHPLIFKFCLVGGCNSRRPKIACTFEIRKKYRPCPHPLAAKA
jgi:hypothetical protein